MTKKLSDWETMRRRDAVDFADASLRLEGFETSPESSRRAEQFVAGELELRQLVPSNATPTASALPTPRQQGDAATSDAGPAPDAERERARRQQMVDRVNASSALEGYTPDAHLEELQRRFVALEIGTAEMLESCREFALKMAAQPGDTK